MDLATLQASKFQNITTKQKWLLQRIIVGFAANSMKLLSLWLSVTFVKVGFMEGKLPNGVGI